jgi:cell division protein FtsI (penicillin-binding protein 3)
MSFGYEVLVSPLQTLMLYNAVANNGKMMKPYLVNQVSQDGISIKTFQPHVLEQAICSESTLKQLQECLDAVCNEDGGTGYVLFKNSPYRVAGKTGTALVANGKRGYSDHIYQSSFAGYFPSKNPKYSIIVVIKNKPFAKKYYGASVAGPVFKEISDKLYATLTDGERQNDSLKNIVDSSYYLYAGAATDMKKVLGDLSIKYSDSSGKSEYNIMADMNYQPVMKGKDLAKNHMPDVKGMGLKDALFVLENRKVKVIAKGKGKVFAQSVSAGVPISKGQTVVVELN